MAYYHLLWKFDKIRLLTQGIKNEKFTSEFKRIVKTVIDKYDEKNLTYKESDEGMKDVVIKVVKDIERLAQKCQHVPNHANNYYFITADFEPNFTEHDLLMGVEMICKIVVEEIKTNKEILPLSAIS